MRKLGFEDAQLTTTGADGGLDITAERAVAQVKHYASPVGSPAVQQLRGAAHGHEWAVFYARSGFTRSAVEYADAARVALFTFTSDGHVGPANDAGRFLQERAGGGNGFDVDEFELEKAQKQLAQELFDRSCDLYFRTAERAIELATSNTAARSLRDTLTVETRRVKAAIERVSNGSMPMGEIRHVVQGILDATERVAIEVEQFED